MASVEVPNTPQCQLAHEWLKATTVRDVDGFVSLLHKDFRHSFHPRSLGRPGLSTKDEWLEAFTRFINLWVDSGKMTYHSFIEVPGKVIVHFSGEAMTQIGLLDRQEVIMTFHTAKDENGVLKIIRIDEFLDSKAFVDLFKAVEEAKANKPSA